MNPEMRRPDIAPYLLRDVVTTLNALIDYERGHGDPFGMAESVERPRAQLDEVLRRIEDGEL